MKFHRWNTTESIAHSNIVSSITMSCFPWKNILGNYSQVCIISIAVYGDNSYVHYMYREMRAAMLSFTRTPIEGRPQDIQYGVLYKNLMTAGDFQVLLNTLDSWWCFAVRLSGPVASHTCIHQFASWYLCECWKYHIGSAPSNRWWPPSSHQCLTKSNYIKRH